MGSNGTYNYPEYNYKVLPYEMCEMCRLRNGILERREKWVFAEQLEMHDPKEVRLLIIGPAPETIEEMRRRPFISPSGQALRKIIRASSFPEYRILLTNLLMCKISENRKPQVDEVSCCRSHIGDIFKQYANISGIILAGEIVWKRAKILNFFLKNIKWKIECPYPVKSYSLEKW